MFALEMRGVSGGVGGVPPSPGVVQEGMKVVAMLPDSQVGSSCANTECSVVDLLNRPPCSVLMRALALVFLPCTPTPLRSGPGRTPMGTKQLFGLVWGEGRGRRPQIAEDTMKLRAARSGV